MRMLCRHSAGAISYLHVPKTASVFATWVWAYGCIDLTPTSDALRLVHNHNTTFTNLSWARHADCPCLRHQPARMFHHMAIWSDGEAAATVGLFRDPTARTVSAYNYGLHVHGATIGREMVDNVSRARCLLYPGGCDPARMRLERCATRQPLLLFGTCASN